MKFNGINHLAMATGDMDATIRAFLGYAFQRSGPPFA